MVYEIAQMYEFMIVKKCGKNTQRTSRNGKEVSANSHSSSYLFKLDPSLLSKALVS